MNVEDKVDGGILLQRRLNGRQRPVIGPSIFGIVIERAVMEHGNTRLPQFLRNGVPHVDHIVPGVRGAAVPGPDHLRTRYRRVALTAVGVENQHLRRLAGEFGGKGLLQFVAGEGVFCGITDVHPAKNRVAAGVCGNQRLGGHAVVRSGSGLGHRRLGRFLYRLRHRGRCLSLRRFLALAAEFVNVPPRGK